MRNKTIQLSVSALLLLASVVVLAPLAGCSEARAADYNVVHYYRPGCSDCTQMTEAVRALEAEFPGQVKTVSYDATSPKHARLVRNMEFGDHGFVVRGRRGEVLFKAGGHNANIDQVRQALRQLIDQKQASL
jgi:hypothetical protein